jgi:hypothetical protein
MNEMRQLVCFLGIFSVPILVFLLSSVVVSWILQSHLISTSRVPAEEIPSHKFSHIATLSTLAAIPVAISVGMAWFSNVCLGEFQFDFITPAMIVPVVLLLRH